MIDAADALAEHRVLGVMNLLAVMFPVSATSVSLSMRTKAARGMEHLSDKCVSHFEGTRADECQKCRQGLPLRAKDQRAEFWCYVSVTNHTARLPVDRGYCG